MKKPKAIQIEPVSGGVKLFVPIEPGTLKAETYPELLIRAHQTLLVYLLAAATQQLPVIA